MKRELTDQVLLGIEELDQRIAPGLTDLCGGIGVTVPTIPTTECPPPPPEEECPPPSDETDGGNNGYGNDGNDGVPGNSTDNDSPNSDEKEADVVR